MELREAGLGGQGDRRTGRGEDQRQVRASRGRRRGRADEPFCQFLPLP